jgi:hypothetical protein
MKNLLILGLTTVLFSCASRNYYQTDKWKNNNTVTIKSDNLKQNTLLIVDENMDITPIDESSFKILKKKKKKKNNVEYKDPFVQISKPTNEIKILFDGFKNKDLKLTLTHSDYEQVPITIEKTIRTDALIADLSISVLTFGLPFLIDPFKSDFYRIKKSSKNINIVFDFNQSYMKNEYKKISNSNNIQVLNDWINKYPKSDIIQKVIDQRDSIEFSIALSEQRESSLDYFITSHKNSKYLDTAKVIKSEMQTAREMFEKSSITNTIESYEFFLQKFPKSLHSIDAEKRLLLAAEKLAIQSNSIDFMKKYILDYLVKFSIHFKNHEIEEKKRNIISAIDNQLIKENLKSVPNELYSEYSNLWKAFVKIKHEIPTAYSLDFPNIKSNYSKICDVIFSIIKETNTLEEQKLSIEKVISDFPEFAIQKNALKDMSSQYILSILNNLQNSTGNIKLFKVGYLEDCFKTNRNLFLNEGNKAYFEYKNKSYAAFENVDSEEISINEGKLEGQSKCFSNHKMALSVNFSNNLPQEINYYLEDKIVNTCFFVSDRTRYTYFYEFENGINLTLRDLELKIAKEQELLNKGIDEESVQRLQSLRSNKYPSIISQNKQLDKLLEKAKQLKDIEDKKKEAIQLAEQRKRDEQRKNREEQEQEQKLVEAAMLESNIIGLYKANHGNFILLKNNGVGQLSIEDNINGLGQLTFTWEIWHENKVKIKSSDEYGTKFNAFFTIDKRDGSYVLKYQTYTGNMEFIKF